MFSPQHGNVDTRTAATGGVPTGTPVIPAGNSDGLPPLPPKSTVGIESLTVQIRIPDFWTAHPRLWFAQFESVMAPQKASDEAKFHAVVARLGLDALQQVSDILSSPPAANKYDAIKTRLIHIFEESETRQLQKLLGEMELGDQKPSQLLRKMSDLAKNKMPDGTLQILWSRLLPPSARAVLSASDSKDLVKLAQIADAVIENIQPQVNIAPISRSDDIGYLTKKIEEMSLELAELRRGRSRERSSSRHRYNSRSKSRQRNWVCYFHRKFGDNATKCANRDGCTYKKHRKPSEN